MAVNPSNIASFIIDKRVAILLVIAVITALSIGQVRNLEVYNEVDIWLDRSGPEYRQYLEFIEDFGNDETIILLIHSDSLFSNPMLKLNHELTDSLSEIPGVERVISLSSVKVPSTLFSGERLVPLLPKASTNPDKIRKRVLQHEIYLDHLISADGKTTSFNILLDPACPKPIVLSEVYRLSEHLVKKNGEPVVFGIVPLKVELNQVSGLEARTFLMVSILVIFLLNFFLFRRIKESILPLITALLTICWTFGLMSWFNVRLNVIISILPLILLVLSIAFSVHFLAGMIKIQKVEGERRAAVIRNFSKVFMNCFYSALTTAISLFVFTFSDILPLKHFGIFSSIGVILAFLLTFTLLPVIYSFFPIRSRSSFFDKLHEKKIRKLAGWVTLNKRAIYAGSAVILTVSVYGISQLTFNTDQISYLKRSNKLRIANEKAGQWFSGIYPIELIVELDTGIFINPDFFIRKFGEFEQKLQDIPEVRSWQSPTMIVDEYARVYGERLALKRLDQDVIKSGDVLSHFISADGKVLRITIKTSWLNDRETLRLVGDMEGVLKDVFDGTRVGYHFTGFSIVVSHLSERLVHSQVRSISYSFIMILVVFLLIYRNFRLALLCLIPNVLPVASTLGLMGLLGVPIDVATVLLASVSLGIAIDDTIHFVGVYRESVAGGSPYDAIISSYLGVGKPIISTTLILVCGFLVLTFSSYIPIVFLGAFISLNVFFALIYDLVLLPAIFLHNAG